jgi:D-serine deaminase-like pyridoxal phosphate-dependent protein
MLASLSQTSFPYSFSSLFIKFQFQRTPPLPFKTHSCTEHCLNFGALSSVMQNLSQLRTPSFIVYKQIVQNNVNRMAKRAQITGVQLRPHFKTHKCLQVAKMQAEASQLSGFVVSTLAEAHAVCSEQSLLDIPVLYGMPVAPFKLKEILGVNNKFSKPKLQVMIDNHAHIEALKACQGDVQNKLEVFLKVDAGYGRAGRKIDLVIELAKKLVQSVDLSKIVLKGLYSHSGNSYNADVNVDQASQDECRTLVEAAKTMKSFYDEPLELSVGSTPSCSIADGFPGVTEIHPGNYAFYDLQMHSRGACEISDIAVSVLARVVGSYPEKKRLIVDAGGLAMSKDTHVDKSFGRIKNFPHLKLVSVSQEHGIIEAEQGHELPFNQLPIDSIVEILPNHSCLSAACFKEFHVCSNSGEVIDKWTPVKFW